MKNTPSLIEAAEPVGVASATAALANALFAGMVVLENLMSSNVIRVSPSANFAASPSLPEEVYCHQTPLFRRSG